MSNQMIFGAHAPAFYAAGVPVIPLHYHDKRPVLSDWSKFHDHLPNPDLQAQWIANYANCNMGVVLGAQSRLAVIDIDTKDEDLEKLILSCLHNATGGIPSPWQRRGSKGVVLAYRYNGVPTFRIKDIAGNTLVEYLSSRTQVVLPPSIHPDTGKPYVENVPLLSVLDQLPELDQQIEQLLRGALKEAGIELSYSGWTKVTEFTPVGARDVQMTKVAGHYAYGVMRGELPLAEAIERMKAWYSTCTEKIAGDDISIEKGIQNLIKFVVRDVIDRGKILPQGWDEGLDENIREWMGIDEEALRKEYTGPEDEFDRWVSQRLREQIGLSFTQDHEEWDYDRMKSYLLTQFERHPPESAGRINAINYVLEKISKAHSLNRLDEDRILRYIVEAGGMRVNMTSLRHRLKDLAAGEVKGTDHTEIAQATIRDLEQFSPLRFHAGRFWTWGGAHWVVKDENEILNHIAAEYGGLPAAKRNSDHRGILKTMATLVEQRIQTVDVKGVNFANGVLMQNMELKPHSPDYGMTYTLPFRYLPELSGKAFKFSEFLSRCWGDDEDYEDKVSALQEAMCATIFGLGPKFQRAILLHGAPKSGKSQLLKIVASLVPDQARSNCPPDQWGDKFAPATMYGALINICGELSDKRAIDGQKFKSIIDGDELAGQFKGKDIFNFRPICTHWFASNHLPRTDDTSSGFNRRWLILTFSRPISGSERILDYGEIIVAEEREAIAAWAVEAMPRLMAKNEYTLPASHEEAIREVANMNNSVRFFIEESGRVRRTPLSDGERISHHTSEMRLHGAYYSFCLGEGGARPVGPRAFRQKMRELGTEMGFRLRIVPSESGTPVCVYDGLILVDEAIKSN